MSVKLLIEHRLEFVSLKGGCTGSSKCHHDCWKSHVAAQFMSRCVRYTGYIRISKKRKNSDKYHKSSFSCMQCAVSCSSSLKLCFFSCKPMKRRHSYSARRHVLLLSPLSCAKATACYPSLKTTTTRGLIVCFFDLKHVREPLPCPFVCD